MKMVNFVERWALSCGCHDMHLILQPDKYHDHDVLSCYRSIGADFDCTDFRAKNLIKYTTWLAQACSSTYKRREDNLNAKFEASLSVFLHSDQYCVALVRAVSNRNGSYIGMCTTIAHLIIFNAVTHMSLRISSCWYPHHTEEHPYVSCQTTIHSSLSIPLCWHFPSSPSCYP